MRKQLERYFYLPKYVDIMRAREEEIAKLIEFLSKKSTNFEKPKLILIGDYALRAFIPFMRSTRDCDFVLQKKSGWHLDDIKKWFDKDVTVEAFEKKNESGFMRCMKLIKVGKKSVRASIDFMEGEVTGRSKKDRVRINDSFVANLKRTKIKVADKEFEVNVPSYADYLILKVVSARSSDIRDIATMVWKKGTPREIKKRAKKIMPYPEVFREKIKKSILPVVSDKRFLHSWRGTFATTEFDEEARSTVIAKLNKLV